MLQRSNHCLLHVPVSYSGSFLRLGTTCLQLRVLHMPMVEAFVAFGRTSKPLRQNKFASTTSGRATSRPALAQMSSASGDAFVVPVPMCDPE